MAFKYLLLSLLFCSCWTTAKKQHSSVTKHQVSILVKPEQPAIEGFYLYRYSDPYSNLNYRKIDRNHEARDEFESALLAILESNSISDLSDILYAEDVALPTSIINSLHIENVYFELYECANLYYRNNRYKAVEVKYVSPLLGYKYTEKIRLYFIETADKHWKVIGTGEKELLLTDSLEKEVLDIFSVIQELNLEHLRECFDRKTKHPIAKKIYEETFDYTAFMKRKPNLKRFLLQLTEWKKEDNQEIVGFLYAK